MNAPGKGPSEEPLTFERMEEIGTDLVRLGVCDKHGPHAYGFSLEFTARLVRNIAGLQTAIAPDAEDQTLRQQTLNTMPDFVPEKYRVPLWVCRFLLEDHYLLKSDTDEGIVRLGEYLVFCHRILERVNWDVFQRHLAEAELDFRKGFLNQR